MSLAVLDGQVPLEMVHVYIYVPETDTEAVEDPVPELLKVAVPGPDVCVHIPAPMTGVLPPSALLVKPQMLCIGPAVAGVGVL